MQTHLPSFVSGSVIHSWPDEHFMFLQESSRTSEIVFLMKKILTVSLRLKQILESIMLMLTIDIQVQFGFFTLQVTDDD